MTSDVPADRLYSAEHVWVQLDAGRARIGITDFAQQALGDLVFVRMRPVGSDVAAAASVGEIESLKSTSEVYAPLAGKVALLNPALEHQPELVNSDPYGEGWLCELEVADAGAAGLTAVLLAAEGYRAKVGLEDT